MSWGRANVGACLGACIGAALIGGGATSCDQERHASISSAAPSDTARVPPPREASFVHVVLPMDEHLDENVMRHVRTAYARGLLPVAHTKTPWNMAAWLARNLEDPRVQAELDGIYLIEIDYDGDCLDHAERASCKTSWIDVLCFTYANVLVLLDRDGRPASALGSPGKGGPTTPEGNAKMLHSFRELVQRGASDPTSWNRCQFLEHDG